MRELAGRDFEIGRIMTALRSAAAGHGTTLVLRGPAGIGKSALLGHCACAAAEAGWRILRHAGRAAAPLESIDTLLHPLAGERAARFLAGDEPPERGGPRRMRQYRGSIELLDLLGGELPTLLAVDDAQWLDAESWDLLTFAGRRFGGEPVVLLLAMRDGTGTNLRLDGSGLAELPLRPLGDEAAEAVVRAAAPALGGGAVRRVREEAAGNPRGLKDLAAAAARSITVREAAGTTQRLPARELPARELLSADELRVAELAALGLGNREIGTRLGLTPRTVGSHLTRILSKLDVGTRAGLGKVLGAAAIGTISQN